MYSPVSVHIKTRIRNFITIASIELQIRPKLLVTDAEIIKLQAFFAMAIRPVHVQPIPHMCERLVIRDEAEIPELLSGRLAPSHGNNNIFTVTNNCPSNAKEQFCSHRQGDVTFDLGFLCWSHNGPHMCTAMLIRLTLLSHDHPQFSDQLHNVYLQHRSGNMHRLVPTVVSHHETLQ